jgi:cell pole-organizing protein PopZ
MADQTAKGQGADDPSMEEILQSIKKIIADDDKGVAPAAPKPNGIEAVPGSDVLELTEMVKDDGTVETVTASVQVAPAVSAPAANDVLSKIDEALAVEPPKTAPSTFSPAQPQAPQNTLLSDQAALAAASQFKKLQVEEPLPPLVTSPSPMLASGNTVEAMVMQMLKPMMKEWLDANLPTIVERIVTLEIRKLTK